MEHLDTLIADLALILVAAGLVSLIFKKLVPSFVVLVISTNLLIEILPP